jgi:small-conductance mechanosensitive channel
VISIFVTPNREIMEWFKDYKVIVTVFFVVLYVISRFFATRIIKRRARKNQFEEKRTLYLLKLFHSINLLIITVLIVLTWDINLRILRDYLLGFLTIVGVAVFASWSILSNLTSSVILFFYYTYKVGSIIRIVDGTNSITGRILEITLFYIKLQTKDRNIISYPNNLAIQRPIIELKDWDSETGIPIR